MQYNDLQKYIRSQPASNPNQIRAKLVDISDYYAAGTVPPSWDTGSSVPLWINPQTIQWAIESTYSTQSGHLSTNQNLQWGYSARQPIEIPDIIIWTDDPNSDVTGYLDTLESLTRPSINSYPPVLALVWGARVLQPIVLSNLSVTERSWANGLVSSASVNLTFLYTKAPKYRSNADERRLDELSKREQAKVKKDAENKLGLAKDAEGRLKVGKPTSNQPNVDQNKPITVNSKGEVLQGDRVVARYTKKDANGSFVRDSFIRVDQPANLKK